MSKMLTCMSNANIMHRADNHVHMLDINIKSDTQLSLAHRGPCGGVHDSSL